MINSFQQQIQAKTQTQAEIQTQVYCFLLVCRTQTENELMMSAELPTGGHFALIHLTYHHKGRIFSILCNTIQYHLIQCYKLAWDTMQYRYQIPAIPRFVKEGRYLGVGIGILGHIWYLGKPSFVNLKIFWRPPIPLL